MDILSIGEILVDLIGEACPGGLQESSQFVRRAGGSPANMARTAALAGAHVGMVGCVGNDGFGAFLRRELDDVGVDTSWLQTCDRPTSLVVASGTRGTPEFMAHRNADVQLTEPLVPAEVLDSVAIVHTTSFGLSQAPAREAICQTLSTAAESGAQVTLDANYAPEIGPEPPEARELLSGVCAYGAFVKVSDDDVQRLFGSEMSVQSAVATLHEWGATLVCLTQGAEGSVVSWDGGNQTAHVPASTINGSGDATGAGDAYWGTFLASHVAGAGPVECCRRASLVAAQKLGMTGPLEETIDLTAL